MVTLHVAIFFLVNMQMQPTSSLSVLPISDKRENWPEAARLTYNAGSSYFNAGAKYRQLAFKYVEDCRQIAVLNDVIAPLSHIEAFYGHNEYWQGNFSAAKTTIEGR